MIDDDVKQSQDDMAGMSQAMRWKAERDAAMQELHQLKREMEKKAIPEGVEWPRYKSGKLVDFGQVIEIKGYKDLHMTVDRISFEKDGLRVLHDNQGERMEIEHGVEIPDEIIMECDKEKVQSAIDDYQSGKTNAWDFIKRLQGIGLESKTW